MQLVKTMSATPKMMKHNSIVNIAIIIMVRGIEMVL